MKNTFNYEVIDELVEKLPKGLFGEESCKDVLIRKIDEYIESLSTLGEVYYIYEWYNDQYSIPRQGEDFEDGDILEPLYISTSIDGLKSGSGLYLTPVRGHGEIVSTEPFTYAVKEIDDVC